MKHTFFALATVLLWGHPAFAHHSGAALYRLLETTTIEGELTQLIIRSPHSWIWIETPDEDGGTERWGFEAGTGSQLAGRDVENPLKVGDVLIVSGHPSRNPNDRRMQLVSIVRPADGFTIDGGSYDAEGGEAP